MNIRELEALLRELHSAAQSNLNGRLALRLSQAVSYCVRQQRTAAKRKVEFKLRSAEQRELLR